MGTVLTSLKKIKPKYIGVWLKDQLSRPDWFRNMVVNRSAWGVFSIYAHARRSDGKAKTAYITKVDAEEGASDLAERYHSPFVVYKCLFCDGWHVSKAVKKDAEGKTASVVLPDKNTIVVSAGSEALNVSRISTLKIPDLHQVYVGFRGRTLSSRPLAYAWPVIRESGISIYIDLREADKSERLPHLCELHGFQYFHYPVDKRSKNIPQMVENFPKLCELIDKGCFYIACAQGLHRTDIALCTYWVFYAADMGIAPPAIWGYRQADGHDTSKIMRVLNAFYQFKSEKDGKDPMPMDVFRERKEIIKELSRKSK